jgi:hypothetical protein
VNDTKLHLHSVADRGVPHLERIVLQASQDLNLSRYALIIGLADETGQDGVPVPDSFLWLGPGHIKQGDWVFVYTGPGTRRADAYLANQVHSIYWGRGQTVFYNPRLVPILLEIGDVALLPAPPTTALPQLATGAIEHKPL